MRTSIVLAVLAIASAAHAGAADRLVLIAPPAPLDRAVHAQLAPYAIDVVDAPDAAPGDPVAARAIAVRYQARAVAWIEGDALVVLDLVDGSIARRPAPVPLDDAGAASLALTLKTVLRSRWELEDRAAAAPPPPGLELAVVAGLRAHGGAAEPRVTLGADLPIAGGAWIGVRGSLGGGVPVHTDPFSGTWNERALGAIGSYAWTIDPIDGRVGGGASAHATAIHGVLLPGGSAAEASAWNLGFDAEASALWRRPPIAIGVRAAATWVPWRQRYTATDQAVLEVSHVEAELGLVVIFAL